LGSQQSGSPIADLTVSEINFLEIQNGKSVKTLTHSGSLSRFFLRELSKSATILLQQKRSSNLQETREMACKVKLGSEGRNEGWRIVAAHVSWRADLN
jgi:hypothetical protein